MVLGVVAFRSGWTKPLQGVDDPAPAGSWRSRYGRLSSGSLQGTRPADRDGITFVAVLWLAHQHLIDPGLESAAVDESVQDHEARSCRPSTDQQSM